MGLLTAALLAATLADGLTEIRFAEADSGFGIDGIGVSGAVGFVHPDGEGPDFWELVFTSGASTNGAVVVSNRAASERVTSGDGRTRTFDWKGLSLPGEAAAVDVRATVRFDERSGKSRWSISVANRSGRYGLRYVRYPYLRGVSEPRRADWLMPSKNAGARVRRAYDHVGPDVTFYSPGYYPMMFACLQDGKGLYVAAEDGDCQAKRLVFASGNSAYFETEVANGGLAGKAAASPGFDVAIAGFDGDWWQAARLYRDWALGCRWARKGPIASRADFPRALAEANVWLVDGGEARSVTGRVQRVLSRHPNLRLALEWTYWNHMPWDTNYPEVFPSRAGVAEGMAALKAKGVFVMPYTNGRLWQTDLAGFRYARGDATTDPDGNLWLDHYTGGAFAVMCPCAAGWQGVLRRNSRRVIDELRAGGVYLDQIAASASRPCFAAHHGHPLGGGNHWWRGYHEALERIRADYGAVGAGITSEGVGESWLDVIDGYLIATEATAGDVPFMPFVYSGRAVYFGSRLPLSASRESQFFVHARALVGGIVPGWVHLSQIRTEEGARRLEDLFRLGEARQAASDYFAYGRLEGEVAFDGASRVTFRWGDRSRVDTPAVIGSVWRNADGRRTAVVAVNVSQKTETVTFAVPAGVTAMRKRELPHNTGTTFRIEGARGELTVAPGEAAVVETEK